MRQYYETLEAAVQDPSSSHADLEALLDPECPCRQILAVLREEARRRRRVDYTLTISNLTVPNATASGGTAHVTVVQSAGHLYDASGRIVERIAPLTQTYFIDVRPTDGEWRILRVSER